MKYVSGTYEVVKVISNEFKVDPASNSKMDGVIYNIEENWETT